LARRILAAVVVALLVVGYVVVRDAERSDATFTVVSGPTGAVIPTVMHARPTRYEVVATPVSGAGHLYLQVGTYLQKPTDTIALTVLDGSGARIARCVFPPRSYDDNAKLACPLRDISRARRLIVTRLGTAKIALYADREKAGFLVRNEATSLGGRISTVLSRIAVPLANGVGSGVLLISLFGSVALTVLALLLVVPMPWERAGGRDAVHTSTGDSDRSSGRDAGAAGE
jgi:hypothetical protein